jgi:hypothetical protein
VTPLPAWAKVVTSAGEVIEPSGRFYVTVNSIDPIHGLVDLF